jgi:hypothetical protein
MEKKMNVSLFWDGLNHYFKMILHNDQNFCESYIDFVNGHREKGVKKIFVIKGKRLYYRKPMTKDLIQIGGDNFGGCCKEGSASGTASEACPDPALVERGGRPGRKAG